jgi:amino acid adenylation domain-containing protein
VDGWSQGLLLEEWGRFHEGGRGGPWPDLSPPRPFRDYVAYLAGHAAEAERFWSAHLAGFREATPLVMERGPSRTFERRSHRVALSAERAEAVTTSLRRHGLTLSGLAAAAWSLVLCRHAQAKEAVVGVTLSGRPPGLPGASTMVGLFIHASPLRVALPDQVPVLDWLRQVQSDLLSLQEQPQVAVEDLRRWCPSALPGAPFFESLMVVENFPLDASRLGPALGVEAISVHDDNHDPLTVVLHPSPGGLQFELSYDAGRFEPEAVARLGRQLEQALCALAASPGAVVREISILGPEDLADLSRWEQGPPLETAGVPGPEALLERWARRAPDAVAVRRGEDVLTYGDLDRRASHLAARLRGLGVGPECVVPLVASRGPAAVAGMMGILRAGGAYAPVDGAQPAARLRAILADAAPKAVVAEDPDSIRGHCACPVIDLRSASPPEPEPVPGAWPEPEEGSAAYVIYTSGSTGAPKGVVVERRQVRHVLACWRDAYRLDPDVRVLQLGSFTADVFTGDWLKALWAGGELIVCPDEAKLQLRAIHQLIVDHDVTVMESTPGLLVPLGEFLHRNGLQLRSVRLLILGADYLRTHEYRTLVERFGGRTRIVNGYGLTECTIESSVYEAPAGQVRETRSGYAPLGRPFGGTRFHVLDEDLGRRPPGAAGELFIGGGGVARGYLGQPELTARRFVHAPHLGGRLYRTGDLARWSGDGQLEHLGRGDHQVKVRGYRVELGEVEDVLLALPGVRAAAVVPGPAGGGLVAHVVLDALGDLDEVRAQASTRLPEVMVPARFCAVEALPLNANGKVDRLALAAAPPPTEPGTGAAARDRGAAPASPVEQRVVEIWRELLGHDRFGLDDSFMASGGSSVQVLGLFNKIQERFSVELDVAELFTHHTVRALARRLEALVAAPRRSEEETA